MFYDQFHRNTKQQDRIITKKNFTYHLLIKVLDNLIRERNNLKILDYGCGAGTVDFYLANRGNYVYGYDVSKFAITKCKRSTKSLNLSQKAYFTSKFKLIDKQQYDIIICSEVLEHVKNYVSLLRILNKLLKPNGALLITTPSINAPLYKLGLLNKFDKEVGHLRRFSEKMLISALHDTGFRVVKMKKEEGLLRNSLFNIPLFSFLVRFIRGPLVEIVTVFDNLFLKLFGESDFFVVASKK